MQSGAAGLDENEKDVLDSSVVYIWSKTRDLTNSEVSLMEFGECVYDTFVFGSESIQIGVYGVLSWMSCDWYC